LIMTKANSDYSVQTHTRASSDFGDRGALPHPCDPRALPAFAGSRSLIQDMFFILTMLVLAQFWNLLAGYGGLVSVGQQAFRRHRRLCDVRRCHPHGDGPVPSILIAGVAALLAIPTAFFRLPSAGCLFRHRHLGDRRGGAAVWWRSGRQSAAARARRCPGRPLARCGSPEWIETLFDVRNAAARDILDLLAGAGFSRSPPSPASTGCCRTKRGLALAAVRDNIEAAKSVGVDAVRMKWTVFLVSAFGTGLAGGLIYVQKARISPDAAFSCTDWTAYVIFIVVIGGIGTIEGPILGVLVFFLLQSLLADYGSWYLMALGVIGIVVMLFAPRGLWGLFSDRTGIQLFPVRRRLTGGRLHANTPSSSKEE
jgi:branched-chain amino acid transport system permease protein